MTSGPRGTWLAVGVQAVWPAILEPGVVEIPGIDGLPGEGVCPLLVPLGAAPLCQGDQYACVAPSTCSLGQNLGPVWVAHFLSSQGQVKEGVGIAGVGGLLGKGLGFGMGPGFFAHTREMSEGRSESGFGRAPVEGTCSVVITRLFSSKGQVE